MLDEISGKRVALIGCGQMGSAMLKAWLGSGFARELIWVADPTPSEWVRAQGVNLGVSNTTRPDVVFLAVKPQQIDELDKYAFLCQDPNTLLISIMAGITIPSIKLVFRRSEKIIRAMPNLPAEIGKGFTAFVSSTSLTDGQRRLGIAFFETMGGVVELDDERQLGVVTAISGSGPAYVFYLIEALEAAAIAEGLSDNLALSLAKATVGGSGLLAEQAFVHPGELRRKVTSPRGTTEAALDVLMDPEKGLFPLVSRAVGASRQRAEEIARR